MVSRNWENTKMKQVRTAEVTTKYLENRVAVVEQVLWCDGSCNVGRGSRHESHGLRCGDVLHYDLQLRHFLDERLGTRFTPGKAGCEVRDRTWISKVRSKSKPCQL